MITNTTTIDYDQSIYVEYNHKRYVSLNLRLIRIDPGNAAK